MIELLGKTTDGHIVVGGVYRFFETHGLPLSDVLSYLWTERRMLPDWVLLVMDMMAAGRPSGRSIEAVTAAVRDACCYPDVLLQGVIGVLEHPNFQKLVKP